MVVLLGDRLRLLASSCNGFYGHSTIRPLHNQGLPTGRRTGSLENHGWRRLSAPDWQRQEETQ
jgi:hypothetical protein